MNFPTFEMQFGNLILRSCDENLVHIKETSTANILVKENDTVYTLAFWKRHKEGYDLQFVGDRPFKFNPELFFTIAKIGQDILDAYFKGGQDEMLFLQKNN